VLEMLHVASLEKATELLAEKTPRLLCRLAPAEIMKQAARVKAGAFDFDGTLVTGSQWKSVEALMPAPLKAEQESIRNWYYAHTNNGNELSLPVTDPDWFHGTLIKGNRLVAEGAWIAESFRLFGKAGITEAQIKQVSFGISPREGALDLLNLFDPRVIISFGIEQVILAWAKHHGVPSAVAASRLQFDDRGVVSGCHINLVASETKEFAADLFRKATGIHEEELLVLGDSVVDIAMMHPNGFNILIVPPSETDKRIADFRHNHLEAMWDKLSLILISDSLLPLVELIETARDFNEP